MVYGTLSTHEGTDGIDGVCCDCKSQSKYLIPADDVLKHPCPLGQGWARNLSIDEVCSLRNVFRREREREREKETERETERERRGGGGVSVEKGIR